MAFAVPRHGTSLIRSRAQSALKHAASAIDRIGAARSGIVILAYHRVGARSRAEEIDLPADLFVEQMELLGAECDPLTLDEALVALRGHAPTGKPAVVVTFDDGTADYLDIALPTLVRLGIPSVVYVATDFIDRGRDFPDEGRVISWNALNDALSTGLVTIGSHTHTHALLDRLDAAATREELDRSRALIQERTGVLARHFAYPKALLANSGSEPVVRRLFESAAIAGTRANRYGATDPWRLARSPVQRSDGMHWFVRKLAGGLRFEDDVRRVVNRVRYAGATS